MLSMRGCMVVFEEKPLPPFIYPFFDESRSVHSFGRENFAFHNYGSSWSRKHRKASFGCTRELFLPRERLNSDGFDLPN